MNIINDMAVIDDMNKIDNTIICSWDVGIKNLAYCIINKSNDSYDIEKWNVINLINDVVHLCNHQNQCKKKAKFVCEYDSQYYCGIHKRKYLINESDVYNQFCLLETTNHTRCQHILPNKKIKCNAKAKYVHNKQTNDCEITYLCNNHYKILSKKMIDERQLKCIKKKSSYKHNINDLTMKLFKKLEENPELLKVNFVLIENQKALSNPIIKTISVLLFSYFTIRGLIDKKNILMKDVKFYSASNKLKNYLKNGSNEIVSSDTVKKANLKKLAIEYTKELLKNNNIWLNHLNSFEKKDDLCDCFLQGYHFLFPN